MSLKKKILNYLFKIKHRDYEKAKLQRLIRINSPRDADILEVGCGRGRIMSALKLTFPQIMGVDINPELVKAAKDEGLNDYTLDELQSQFPDKKYDVIVLAHIVEHFTPDDLLKFLEEQIQRLKDDGRLVILTPFMSEKFFDDYDHIKPYQPHAFKMIFSKENEQIQYQSSFNMELRDIEFCRSPFFHLHAKGLFISNWSTKFHFLIQTTLALFFELSFGLIGQNISWIGIFQKTKD